MRALVWLVALLACQRPAGAIRDSRDSTPQDSAPPDSGQDSDPPIDSGDSGSGEVPCPTYGEAVQVGTVESDHIFEASGLVASRAHPGVWWVHNDSGDAARVFAISTSGLSLGTFQLLGATAQDWEDITLGPGPKSGVDYLYVGDIGDNAEARGEIAVWRVEEPTVTVDSPVGNVDQAGAEKLILEYPDHPHNAETLLSDPRTGDLFVLTKSGSGDSGLFRAPFPHAADVPITLEDVGHVQFGRRPLSGSIAATGGDVSADGDLLVVRTYNRVWVWRRGDGPVETALTTPVCPATSPAEVQGEAVGFAPDGRSYLTISEGSHPKVWRIEEASQ